MLSSSIRSIRSFRSLDDAIDLQQKQQQPLRSCIRRERSPSQEFQLKKVIFDEVEVKEYPRMLGDNPAVSEGVPLTIDWKPQSSYSMDVDLFESMRCPVRRRGRKQLLISSMSRVQSLVEAGYSLEKIGETIVRVDKARNLRFESATESGWNFSKVFGGLQAAIHGLKIKQPKRKSVTNPAC